MDDQMLSTLQEGLNSKPKYIPVWYRYDKQGSLYNDRCLSENKYYYFYPSEMSIIRQYTKDMVNQVQQPLVFVDMGSGNSEKTRILLDNVLTRQASVEYMPVDISEEFLIETTDALRDHYGDKLTASPIAGDYNKGISALSNIKGNKLITWLGGGFQNQAYPDQVDRLQRLSKVMNENDRLVIALDITQDAETVENAYLDPTGVSAPLYLNAVWRLNREMKSNIDTDKFTLHADFCKNTSPNSTSYTTMYLKSKADQQLEIPGLGIRISFKADECLYLHEGKGVSCKYTHEQIRDLAKNGNLSVSEIWTDSEKHVALCSFKVIS